MACLKISVCPVQLLLMACCLMGCDQKQRKDKEATSVVAEALPSTGEKDSRTNAQQKLDSHLVLALKKSRGEPPFDKPVALDPDVVIEEGGGVMVDITAMVSPALLAFIEAEGGQVINRFESAQAIRARVLLPRLEALASRADIKFIAPAAQATTNGVSGAAAGGNMKPPSLPPQ